MFVERSWADAVDAGDASASFDATGPVRIGRDAAEADAAPRTPAATGAPAESRTGSHRSHCPVSPAAPMSDPLPLAQLESEITELAGHLNAASHRWLVLVAEFDRREGWADGGFTRSCAQWLAWKCGIDRGAAREKLRVARALEGLPAIGAAMAQGRLSYSKVRALSRVATAATEQTLLGIALHGTADHVERVVRGLRRAQEAAELSREARQHAARSATVRWEDDGSLLLQVRLGAEAGAVVLRALQAAERAAEGAPAGEGVSAETREGCGEGTAATETLEPADPDEPADTLDTPAQRRADALLRLAEGWLAHGGGGLAGGERHAIVVHVDAAVLGAGAGAGAAPHGGRDPAPAAPRCELEHGPAIAAETARRLACDASVVTLAEDARGRPLDVGRSTRTVPAALGRALRARDDARCRYPGCTHRHALDAHHIRHWADGGATRLSNLVLLCRTHHRQVHEGGTRVQRLDDGALRFVDARGRTLEAAPPTAGTLTRLLAANAARGIRIDAATATGLWCGEDMDLDMAVAGLCAQQARGAAAMAAP
jgi:hypothetical protein